MRGGSEHRRPRPDPDPSWRESAACKGSDPALFFPERGGDSFEIKATCQPCPVRIECLTYALEAGEDHGVWGGTSERERRGGLRRKWKRGELDLSTVGVQPLVTCAECGRQVPRHSANQRTCPNRDCKRALQAHADLARSAQRRERAS